ncbi:alpha-ribazole phosphatase [Myxococcaceae bacterium]|jgi:probable phosphoglycerate mutase|nr:alpha-ribazole phosphatase [Myxococcaceae bacterium]
MRRLVLLRHGESTADSAHRFLGSSDPDLSAAGREQMQIAAARLRGEGCDVVAASPLRRAWQSARVVANGRSIRLVDAFRERHLGRWEGLTREEAAASDPVRFEDWRSDPRGFEFPGGEPAAEFSARVERGLRELASSPGHSALVVTHSCVIREIAALLAQAPLDADHPALGEAVELVAQPDGTWRFGRRSSNPPGVESAA